MKQFQSGVFLSARRLFAVLAFLCALFSSFSSIGQSSADTRLPSGFERVEGSHSAPKTLFADQDGQLTSIERFTGKVIVMNLWATWCAPCVKELPSLARLTALLPASKFTVIAVSQDKGGLPVAKPFLERLEIRGLPTYFDPTGRVYRDFGGRGLPTTFIIGPDGVVVSRLEGFTDWDAETVVSYLLSLAQN